jgi:hypothetical protein
MSTETVSEETLAIARSRSPSRSRSVAASDSGPFPSLYVRFLWKPPALFVSTVTVSVRLAWFTAVTASSGLASPFRSAIAIRQGFFPAL